MTKEEAIRATRNGAIAACISAAVTMLMLIIAIGTDAGGVLALWNNPLNFADIVLILACAFGMYKHSRTAAVLIFTYFIASKAIIMAETKIYSGIWMSIIFLYFYGKAIQGAFAYHAIEKRENPEYRGASRRTVAFLCAGVAVVVIIASLALFSTFGVMPSTRVMAGSEVSASDLDLLRENGVLSPDAEIEYFYSQGLTSILEGGSVLTKDAVIIYYTDEQNIVKAFALLRGEITSVDLEQPGGVFRNSVYVVRTETPDRWMKLLLSIEQKGDEKFVSAIRDGIN